MVVGFTPFSSNFNWQTNKQYVLTEAPQVGHTYKVVLDATIASDAQAQIFVGTTSGYYTFAFPKGQDGIITMTKAVTRSMTYSKRVWFYCRGTNDGVARSATVRNLEIYDIT